MSQLPPSDNSRRDIPFFGRIAAGVSHDIRNVLSIIHQYAGLLEDITLAAKNGPPVSGEKLLEISSDIQRQVQKGSGVMGRFSRFSHATDDRTEPHDLGELVENMSSLAERHVAQAACRLETEPAAEPILVEVDPFGLQYAVFHAIELVLQFLPADRAIAVTILDDDTSAAISITADTGPSTNINEFTQLASHLITVVDELAGSVDIRSSDGTVTVQLRVPKA